MSKQQQYLVGHILHVLQENHISFDQVMARADWESALAEDSELHAAVELIRFMDEMPGGFLIYQAGGSEKIVYANRALLRIFQCETMAQFRALTHNSFQGLVHPDDLKDVEESIRAQIAASQYDLDYVEYRIIRADGAIRWIEDYGHFVQDETAGSYFYVFLTDATEKRERHQAEQARLMAEKLQGEQRLAELIREYDEERALINQEYLRRLEVIEGLSINYESIFYVDLAEDQILPYRLSMRGDPIFEGQLIMRSFSWAMAGYADVCVYPEDREMFANAMIPANIRARLADSKTCCVNYRGLNGGEVQYLQLRIMDVGRQGVVNQLVMGCWRMDEELQREMEQRQMLAQALKEANLAIDAKNAFLANMSHDMRTPLNAIFGCLTLARGSQTLDEAVESYLDQIKDASQRLLELINKVLELAQTESGGLCLAEDWCNVGEVLESVYNRLYPLAEARNIALSLDCSGIKHLEVWSDRDKLRQIMLYLVDNAIHYTKPGGQVNISAQEGEIMPNGCALYQLKVEDSGVGISPEFLPHIFESFARERNTTFSGVHGMGLGLTIAKKLANLLDGQIKAASVPGEGSSFVLKLRMRANPQSASHQQQRKAKMGGKSILLVEDNEINMEIETEILKSLGFFVTPAADGREAVEKLSASSPGDYDLILMDIQMPVMDGWKATAAIRRLPDPALASIPIIAVSANSFESDVRKSMESGMDAHLPKPLNVPQLLETIERVSKGRLEE